MADTKYQVEIENWIRKHLDKIYKVKFNKEKLLLRPGGKFEFDFVSEDKKIIGSISTSKYKTESGKNGTGKLLKLKSDILYLLLVKGRKRKIMVFTEEEMYRAIKKEMNSGRLPKDIELLCVSIPKRKQIELKEARSKAIKEINVIKISEAI